MILSVAGLDLDPATRRISSERGSVILDRPVFRLFAALMERPEAAVSLDTLLEAFAGDRDEDDGSQERGMRRALRVVRVGLVLLTGSALVVTEGSGGDLFVLGPRPRNGTPAALRKPKRGRPGHVNVSVLARLVREGRATAR